MPTYLLAIVAVDYAANERVIKGLLKLPTLTLRVFGPKGQLERCALVL